MNHPRFAVTTLSLAALALALAAVAFVSFRRERLSVAAPAEAPRFEHLVLDDAPLAGVRINDLRIGDLDGDGREDVWVSGRGGGAGSRQMVWYRGGDWTRQAIARGDFRYGCLVDIDQDGDLDVAVGSDNDARVYWFENGGRPARGDWPRHDPAIEGKPDMIHTGDLDGDGRADLICLYKDRALWARNPGRPGPWRVGEIWSGGRRTGGTVADIDGDGDLDLLYGNAWFESDGAPLDAPWPMHEIDPGWPTEARGAVGDLDGDGRVDVVLSGEESAHGIAWFRSTDRGRSWERFQIAPRSFEKVHSLAIGDFDRDGRPDIFAAEMHTSRRRRVAVFLNRGPGERWPVHVLATTGSHNAAIADLNGDGWLDIAGKNFEAGEIPLRIDLWWNRKGTRRAEGTGGSEPRRWRRIVIDRLPHRALFLAAVDLDADDLPEVLTGGWVYGNPGSIDGAWERREIGAPFANLALAHDLDGDGDLDLLGTSGRPEGAELVRAENRGAGAWRVRGALAIGEGDFLQGVAAIPIAGRDEPAIVLSWHRAAHTQLLLAPGADAPGGEWTLTDLSPVTHNEGLAVGDFDGDGDADILLGTRWLEQAPDGAWPDHDALELGVAGADPDRVEAGDVDGDGDLDAVIGCEHAALLAWAENPGEAGARWTEHRIATDGLFQSLDLGDVDADGDLDVVAGLHKSAGEVLLFRNLGAGRSWSREEVDPGDGAVDHHDGTRFADLDGDGDLDIVSIGWTVPVVTLYENLGSAARGAPH